MARIRLELASCSTHCSGGGFGGALDSLYTYLLFSMLESQLSRILAIARMQMPKSQASARKDGRKPLLVYLHPQLIKQLKKRALDQDTTAYELTEQALRKWLANHKSKAAAARGQGPAR